MSRQNYNDTWSSGGDKVDPGGVKTTLGWIVEAPPHEYFNFWQGKTDEMLQHLERNGISTYDAATIYEIGGYCREGVVTYRSLVVTNTGNLPSTSPSEWVQAFLVPSNNLSDLADVATDRTNLGVYSTTQSDANYLPIAGKAADSELLDGYDSSAFPKLSNANNFTGAMSIDDNLSFNRYSRHYDYDDGPASANYAQTYLRDGNLFMVGVGNATPLSITLNGDTVVTDALTASETVEGLVERATDAEAAAGTDTTRYISAKQLADNASSSPPASETVAGIVERATDAEAAAGTDTTRYISAKQLADNGGAPPHTLTTYTSSGTYTKPAGLVYIRVTVTGGGGGGGAAAGGATGFGGGGGGTAIGLIPAANLAATEAYTVGAGGTGMLYNGPSAPTLGTDGGESSFDTTSGLLRGLGGAHGESTTAGLGGDAVGQTAWGHYITHGHDSTSRFGARSLQGDSNYVEGYGWGGTATQSNNGGVGRAGLVTIEEFF